MKLLLIFIFGVAVTSAESLQIVRNLTSFTNDVYQELSGLGTFFVSPLSVETILALIRTGANGATAEQLSRSLHLSENNEVIEESFRDLVPRLKGNDKYTLKTVNKMYVMDGYEVKPEFKRIAQKDFGADIESIDFEQHIESASAINKWVEEQTNNQITNLVDKEDFDNYTRSVLINTMHFDGKWVYSFPERATAKRDFYLDSDRKIQITMMQQLNKLNYYRSEDFGAEFLELPYEGKDVTMTFVLPIGKNRLASLEERIFDVINAPKYSIHRVQVIIPKFTVETTVQFKEIMQALGVKDAFEEYANFQGILKNERLKIDKIVQKAFLEVKESGTVASIASSVEMIRPRSPLFKPNIVNFTAEQPFIYYIKKEGIVLFIGKYSGV